MLPLLLAVPLLARGLNALMLGEAEAYHLGLPVQRIKALAILLVALAVGASVATAGVIGFVGIVVPHLVRLVVGPDHRLLLPLSALGGAALLVGADIVARLVVAPAELPIGIVTAAIGAPFFLWLLLRRSGACSMSEAGRRADAARPKACASCAGGRALVGGRLARRSQPGRVTVLSAPTAPANRRC